MKCLSHKNEDSLYICLNEKCKKSKKFCKNCIQTDHNDHEQDILEISKLVSILSTQQEYIKQCQFRIQHFIKVAGIMNTNLEKRNEILKDLQSSLQNHSNLAGNRLLQFQRLAKLREQKPFQQNILNNQQELNFSLDQFFPQENIICNCQFHEKIEFLKTKTGTSLQERVACAKCQSGTKDNLNFFEATKLIEKAEQEEKYVFHLMKLKQCIINFKTVSGQAIEQLEKFINFRLMTANPLFVKQGKSIKQILTNFTGKLLYQNIAEFLSEYKVPEAIPSDQAKIADVMAIFGKIYKPLSNISGFDEFKDCRTIICDIEKSNKFEETQVIVIKEDATPMQLVNLIISLIKDRPSITRVVLKVKQETVKRDDYQKHQVKNLIQNNEIIQLIF